MPGSLKMEKATTGACRQPPGIDPRRLDRACPWHWDADEGACSGLLRSAPEPIAAAPPTRRRRTRLRTCHAPAKDSITDLPRSGEGLDYGLARAGEGLDYGLGPVPEFRSSRKRARARARARKLGKWLSIGWRVCSMGSRWFDSNWTIGSGRKSLRSWQKSGAQVGEEMTIGSSWRPSCGGGGRAHPGEIFRQNLDHGRRCSTGLIGSRRRARGPGCFRHCKQTATMSGTASTAQSTERTSTPPAERGGSRARHRSFTWRPLNQDPPGCRRSGSTACV